MEETEETEVGFAFGSRPTREVRRHYSRLYGLIVTDAGKVEKGALGLPRGAGLGIDLREDLVHSGQVQVESVTSLEPPKE